MKKYIIILFIMTITMSAMAQDVIVKKDGSTILCKVEEILSTEIKYKKWSNLEGPTYTIGCSELTSINYQNGEKDDFSNEGVIRSLELPVYTGEQLRCAFSGFSDYTLYLGENEVTQEELRALLGKEGYESFLSGNQMIKRGLHLSGRII